MLKLFMRFFVAYSGIYKVKNPQKYKGDHTNVVYRSLWELYCFKWCDKNPEVTKWSSEEVVVPYIYEVTNTSHRYFIDLYIEWKGESYIIEIKPKKETVKPKYPGRRTKRYLQESMTFVKNQNKWKAAEKYAQRRGWKFEVWTEDTLKQMSIMKMKASLPPIISNKKG
jgi:hypothetical protein